MDAAVAFARSMVGLRYEDIPGEAVAVVKRILLDALGISVAGSSAPGAKQVIELVREWGGKKESTVLASACRAPAVNAAFANGAVVRILDYNETYDAGGTHPSVPVVPAAFAVAEMVGRVTGRDFLTAVAGAMDLHCRMSLSLKALGDWLIPQLHGFLSAAAVAGKLLGLSEDGMVNAFGLAYAQTSGGRQSTAERVLARGLQGGFSARGGVMAAEMAAKGITGARDSLEGKHGLYSIYHHGNYRPEILTRGLGKDFAILNDISFKPYPGCRQNHPFVDAALQVVTGHGIRAEQVAEVTVFTGDFALALCEPVDVCRSPATPSEAQYSIPYNVALAVVNRNVVLNDFFGDGFRAPAVLEIARKVVRKPEDGLSRKGVEAGKVEIKTRDGRSYSERVDFPRGDPKNPLTTEQLVAKFRDCARWAASPVPPENVDRAIEMIDRLENVDDVRQVVRLLGGK